MDCVLLYTRDADDVNDDGDDEREIDGILDDEFDGRIVYAFDFYDDVLISICIC
jgi:hypothetical protein